MPSPVFVPGSSLKLRHVSRDSAYGSERKVLVVVVTVHAHIQYAKGLLNAIIIFGQRSGRILPLRQRYTAHWDAQSKAGTR